MSISSLSSHEATLFSEAHQAEEMGDLRRAVSLYNQILAANPRYAPALLNLGCIYFRAKKLELAGSLFVRSIESDPSNELAFFNLGRVLDEVGSISDSSMAYKRAIELSPDYADPYYNLALNYEQMGERRLALRHWRVYLALDKSGEWADNARKRIKHLLSQDPLKIVSRTDNPQKIQGPPPALFIVSK